MAKTQRNKTTVRRENRLRDEIGGKFRLLIGAHIGDGPKDCDCDNCAAGDIKNHVYTEGDVINSKQDLVRRHNAGPGSTKFERVDSTYDPDENAKAAPTATETIDFEKMSMQQLREFADSKEIDLTGVTRKDEVLRIVREALQEAENS